MTVLFARPRDVHELPEALKPQLASWDWAGSASQAKLGEWLRHIDPYIEAAKAEPGPYAFELIVGLPDSAPLHEGGRDLDNYLLPVAERIGARQVAAAFGRKVRGKSSFAVSPARPAGALTGPRFATTMTTSSDKPAWRETLRERLVRAGVRVEPPGPLSLTAVITSGPSRVAANLWKPLIDSLGPVLGEHPARGPLDDRITDLRLHHHTDPGLGHSVSIELWWASAVSG